MGSNPISSVHMNKYKIKNCDLSITLKLEITGKNFDTFEDFLNAFEMLDCIQKSTYWKIIPGLNKKDFITILKSPHINKTAQEQFEYRIYNKCIIIRTFKPLLFLSLIKILQNLSFPNIKLKVTIYAEGITFVYKNINLLELFNSRDIKLHRRIKNTLIELEKKSNLNYIQYITIFDLYGELICVKKI